MLLFQKLHRHHCLCHLRRHLQRLANPQTYNQAIIHIAEILLEKLLA
nr:MAG TPA: hypothetical protein [Caudoviricetes sp.]